MSEIEGYTLYKILLIMRETPKLLWEMLLRISMKLSLLWEEDPSEGSIRYMITRRKNMWH